MQYDAYCDECFRFVSRTHAESRKPCPRCGNTIYEIVNYDILMPSGSHPYESQRYMCLNQYYGALEQMQSIKVTNITDDDYRRFIAAGERCISLFDNAMEESFEQDRRVKLQPELPPVIPFVTRLPDMYMRRGHWQEALNAYLRCSQSKYLTDFSYMSLAMDVADNRACVQAIEKIIESGEHSQKAIKKILKEQPQGAVNWALRYYHGFSRTKNGSDYHIEIVPFSQEL